MAQIRINLKVGERSTDCSLTMMEFTDSETDSASSEALEAGDHRIGTSSKIDFPSGEPG
jgi:hypothetical protein